MVLRTLTLVFLSESGLEGSSSDLFSTDFLEELLSMIFLRKEGDFFPRFDENSVSESESFAELPLIEEEGLYREVSLREYRTLAER